MTLNPTRVAEFWSFVRERELIRLRRLDGLPREQWTSDPIMREYSFTNVKREHDRTTRLLYDEFYGPRHRSNDGTYAHPSPEVLLNAAIYRFTGTIEVARRLGWFETWDSERFLRACEFAEAMGEHVFTGAYIIPSGGRVGPKHESVAEFIHEIWNDLFRETGSIVHTDSWQIACERLCQCRGVGSFMAKEILLDYILATGWVPDDWQTWTPVGPGGRRGAGYVLTGEVAGIREDRALEVIREMYADRLQHWPQRVSIDHRHELEHTFVELDLTDVQFQLCEFAKYKKTQLGLGRPRRKFRPTVDHVTQRGRVT